MRFSGELFDTSGTSKFCCEPRNKNSRFTCLVALCRRMASYLHSRDSEIHPYGNLCLPTGISVDGNDITKLIKTLSWSLPWLNQQITDATLHAFWFWSHSLVRPPLWLCWVLLSMLAASDGNWWLPCWDIWKRCGHLVGTLGRTRRCWKQRGGCFKFTGMTLQCSCGCVETCLF